MKVRLNAASANNAKASGIIAFACLVAISLAACAGFDFQFSVPTKDAPELPVTTKWLNTDKPVTLEALRGKIVLLDFATFSCVNCLHMLPFLKHLETKYAGQVQVLTVHSPKFANERDLDYLQKSALKYGITHPIANDADSVLWQAYGAKSWPTMVLIDTKGKIVGQVAGDTKSGSIEKAIDKLVRQCINDGSLKETSSLALVCGKAVSGPLAFPTKLLVDVPTKRLFIADSGHNRVLVCDLNGAVKTVIGTGCRGQGDGRFNASQFNFPQGLAIKDNNLYIADSGNNHIRCANLETEQVSTLENTFDFPVDLALDGSQLYVANFGKHQIWCLKLESGQSHPVAGDGVEDIVDGAAGLAKLAQPSGLALVGRQLYFVDSESSSVRCLNLETKDVSTLVGKHLFAFGDKDGAFDESQMQHPLGIVGRPGTLYVADSFNHKIKTLDLSTRRCATLCGSGQPGQQDGEFSLMSEPNGLAIYNDRMYIADTNNSVVRLLNLRNGQMSTLQLKEL